MNTKTDRILRIEGTAKTPYVYINPAEGKILFKGRVIPENHIEFFRPIINFLEEESFELKEIHACFRFEYFNSTSGKSIQDTFRRLEVIHRAGIKVQVFWYYEEDDEDMLEAGQDYDKIIRLPFKIIEVRDDTDILNLTELQIP